MKHLSNPSLPTQQTIACRDLHISYGKVQALRNVTATLPAGTITCILGHNGSGKSTLLRMWATLVRPTSGQANVLQWDVAKKWVDVRRHIGYMPQDFQPYPRWSAAEFLHYMAALKRIRLHRRDLLALANRVGLAPELLDRRIGSLSGGNTAMLSVAQALIGSPKVFLSDEPGVYLDIKRTDKLAAILRQLGDEKGVTSVIATHQTDFAEALAQYVVVLDAGQVVFGGSRRAFQSLLPGRSFNDVYRHVVSTSS